MMDYGYGLELLLCTMIMGYRFMFMVSVSGLVIVDVIGYWLLLLYIFYSMFLCICGLVMLVILTVLIWFILFRRWYRSLLYI